MPHQNGLHLTRLDPEAPDLHLTVRTPEELQDTIGPPPHQITRAIDPLPRRTVGVGDETLRRQPRLTRIPPGQTHT
ncbi:hypothetical protein, partial [Streptomyces sp. SP18CS02]|uniref:hypothetical protein n=1 Tax=Streptomyces sp. SP18CS02 TaxID=3002531 RepID=UPI002E7AA3E2